MCLYSKCVIMIDTTNENTFPVNCLEQNIKQFTHLTELTWLKAFVMNNTAQRIKGRLRSNKIN